MEYKYQGIVLGKKDVGEVDRIYTIYTLEKGKIRVLAKGVRKPNARLAGTLETITKGEIFIAKNRGLGKITGSIVIDNFANIKGNLNLVTNVFFVFRIVSQIISEEEQDDEIFLLLEKYLELSNSLNRDEKLQEILTVGLLFKIMDRLGYGVEVNRCVNCEKKLVLEKNYLSISRGGILCSDCHANEPNRTAISNEMIKLIRIFSKNKLENLTKLKTEDRDVQKLKGIAKEIISWFSDGSFRV
ncbi:MAG TPA: DNA repair protein RecO [Candidatus Moranbacteria bacterium]|nr:DNA repair protein RecO [Candidatus Moranbacteria bacterium]